MSPLFTFFTTTTRPDVNDVTTFGAVGDGIADDSSAVQSAIDNLEAKIAAGGNGGTVFFPTGKYSLVTGVVVTSGSIILAGAGADASRIVFNPAAHSATLFTFDRGNGDSASVYCGINTRLVLTAVVNVRVPIDETLRFGV